MVRRNRGPSANPDAAKKLQAQTATRVHTMRTNPTAAIAKVAGYVSKGMAVRNRWPEADKWNAWSCVPWTLDQFAPGVLRLVDLVVGEVIAMEADKAIAAHWTKPDPALEWSLPGTHAALKWRYALSRFHWYEQQRPTEEVMRSAVHSLWCEEEVAPGQLAVVQRWMQSARRFLLLYGATEGGVNHVVGLGTGGRCVDWDATPNTCVVLDEECQWQWLGAHMVCNILVYCVLPDADDVIATRDADAANAVSGNQFVPEWDGCRRTIATVWANTVNKMPQKVQQRLF